ncbi:MAG: hypothetical protein HYZ68_03995, partial [Chloroflexi bacterium]|nr:hypothetical protein [Chloroflexota bacterium]
GVRIVGGLFVTWGTLALWGAFAEAGTTLDLAVATTGLIGLAQVLVGIEVARFQRWGFYGAIVLLLIALSFNLYDMWTHPSLEGLLSALLRSGLQVTPVLYLLRPGVQSLFPQRSSSSSLP